MIRRLRFGFPSSFFLPCRRRRSKFCGGSKRTKMINSFCSRHTVLRDKDFNCGSTQKFVSHVLASAAFDKHPFLIVIFYPSTSILLIIHDVWHKHSVSNVLCLSCDVNRHSIELWFMLKQLVSNATFSTFSIRNGGREETFLSSIVCMHFAINVDCWELEARSVVNCFVINFY